MNDFFKRILPNVDTFKKYPKLHRFIEQKSRAQIWQVNRRTIASGLALGLFFGSLPIPMQMTCAAIFAILLRVNLPITVVATWYSNPFTFAPLYYACYQVGGWVLNIQINQDIHFNAESLTTLGGQVILSLYTGAFIIGIMLAILGYCFIRIAWRISLQLKSHQRKKFTHSKSDS